MIQSPAILQGVSVASNESWPSSVLGNTRFPNNFECSATATSWTLHCPRPYGVQSVVSNYNMEEPPTKRTKRTDSAAMWDNNDPGAAVAPRSREDSSEPKPRSNGREDRHRHPERRRGDDRRRKSRSRERRDVRRDRSKSNERSHRDRERDQELARDYPRDTGRGHDRERTKIKPREGGRDEERSRSRDRHKSSKSSSFSLSVNQPYSNSSQTILLHVQSPFVGNLARVRQRAMLAHQHIPVLLLEDRDQIMTGIYIEETVSKALHLSRPIQTPCKSISNQA